MILALSLISTQGLAQQNLTFNVHSNTPPFEWQNEAGEETGFNIELARQIAQKLPNARANPEFRYK